jgi:hypothetical protein
MFKYILVEQRRLVGPFAPAPKRAKIFVSRVCVLPRLTFYICRYNHQVLGIHERSVHPIL